MKKPGIRIINIALVFITAFTIVTACSHNMTTTTTGKPQATSVVDEHADTQAVKSAQSYLRSSNFSRGRLIEQLEYEGFTHEQAEYAVEQVGY